MTRIILALAAAAMLGGALPAAAKPAADAAHAGEEVRVPLFRLGSFRSFRAVDRETLYIRGPGRHWYRVTTMGPCPNLTWARAIGVDAGPVRTLDRHSILLVDGDRCPVRSVVRSGPPPRRQSRR